MVGSTTAIGLNDKGTKRRSYDKAVMNTRTRKLSVTIISALGSLLSWMSKT